MFPLLKAIYVTPSHSWWRYFGICWHTTKLRSTFFPQAVRLTDFSSTLCCMKSFFFFLERDYAQFCLTIMVLYVLERKFAHDFNIYNMKEVIKQTHTNKMRSPEHCLRLQKAARFTRYKQSNTAWSCIIFHLVYSVMEMNRVCLISLFQHKKISQWRSFPSGWNVFLRPTQCTFPVTSLPRGKLIDVCDFHLVVHIPVQTYVDCVKMCELRIMLL